MSKLMASRNGSDASSHAPTAARERHVLDESAASLEVHGKASRPDGSDGGLCGGTVIQLIGPECREKLILGADASSVFSQHAGEYIHLRLRNSITCRVEVFMKGPSAALGSGWSAIRSELQICEGDTASFTRLGDKIYMATFFKPGGGERLPAVSYLPEDSDLTEHCYVGPGVSLTPYLRVAVIDIVRRIRRSCIIYLCRLNHSSANRGVMYFTKDFTTRYIAHETTHVTIKLEGIKHRTSGKIMVGPDKIGRISSGWWTIAAKRLLNEGDICAIALYDGSRTMNLKLHRLTMSTGGVSTYM